VLLNSNDAVLLSLQVVQNGLEILTYLADRMGHDFKPYISSIIQPTIDRLGKIIHPFAMDDRKMGNLGIGDAE
jgi:hypothetical protein